MIVDPIPFRLRKRNYIRTREHNSFVLSRKLAIDLNVFQSLSPSEFLFPRWFVSSLRKCLACSHTPQKKETIFSIWLNDKYLFLAGVTAKTIDAWTRWWRPWSNRSQGFRWKSLGPSSKRNPELYPPRSFLCTYRGPVCRDFSADSFPLPPGYLPRGNNTVFHGRQHDSTFLENRYSVPDY